MRLICNESEKAKNIEEYHNFECLVGSGHYLQQCSVIRVRVCKSTDVGDGYISAKVQVDQQCPFVLFCTGRSSSSTTNRTAYHVLRRYHMTLLSDETMLHQFEKSGATCLDVSDPIVDEDWKMIQLENWSSSGCHLT